MKLYDQFSRSGYHSSLCTTFGVDFDTYESVVLSRLRGSGCRNNLVIGDHRMLAHALEGGSALPQLAGTHYSLGGATASGVFHPKLFMQFGRQGARMILGSANLTPAGLAGNLELVSLIECGVEDSAEQRVIAGAWAFVSRFLDERRQSVRDQMDWLRARTGWLEDAAPAEGPVTLSDGTLSALLTTGSSTGIGSRFTEMIDEPVRRLVAISPYWDHDLAAVSFLQDRLSPTETALLVDPETGEFPKSGYELLAGVSLYGWTTLAAKRFAHAKVFIAQGHEADHVLFGSANCTRAALGNERYSGSNVEACLYRRFPPGSIVEQLRLDSVLDDENLLDPASLRVDPEQPDLPLAHYGRLTPGQFEYHGDSLYWHPPNTEDPCACTIALFDIGAEPLLATLTPTSASGTEPVRYIVSGIDQPPRFARVSFPDGTASSRAVVSVTDTLRTELRERQRSSLQNKIDELENDTEASLALLDILGELESLETSQATPKAPPRPTGSHRHESSPDDVERHRILSYEEFIAGRRPRADRKDASFNSLAGSEVSVVRGILNRIIGLSEPSASPEPSADARHVFDLGDETDDAEGDLSSGHEFDDPAADSEADNRHAESRRRLAQQRQATQDELIKAVNEFQKRVRERQSQDQGLREVDLIRLRILLMILITAASPHPENSAPYKRDRSTIRVLPIDGRGNSWPVVIGRLLFVFFGGKKPAIRQLYTETEHDQVPDDFNECWATCYWCLQLLLQAPLSEESRKSLRTLPKLAQTAFSLTLPSKEELLSEDILHVMDRMSDRYAAQLDIDPVAIREGHHELVDKTFARTHEDSAE